MKITILNPDTVRDLYKNHGLFASVCYGQADKANPETVGRHCAASGHMSGSRAEYIKFYIQDVDRGTTEQCLRSEVGVSVSSIYLDNYSYATEMERWIDINPSNIVKNVRSFRYCDETNFAFHTPSLIKNSPAAYDIYNSAMIQLNDARSRIKEILLDEGEDSGKVNEAVNFLLPRATLSDFCIAFSPEALISFMNKRLCARAQEEIREVAKAMRAEVAKYNERFARELVPSCERLLYCPESKGCGRAPSKETIRALLKQQKNGEA